MAKTDDKVTRPVKTVTITVPEVTEKISSYRGEGKVQFAPAANGKVTVTVQATSKGQKDRPNEGVVYPVKAVLKIDESLVQMPEQKFSFGKSAYSCALGKAIAYRDTEAGVSPAQAKAQVKALDAAAADKTLGIDSADLAALARVKAAIEAKAKA